MLGDILRAVDSGDLAVLTLLDLSAAFDTVDHAYIQRTSIPSTTKKEKTSASPSSSCILWPWRGRHRLVYLISLDGRTQHVRCGQNKSKILPVLFGVPQGSVLGPILFLLYTADLLRLIEIRNFHPHLFADDAQIYGFCRPGGTDDLQGRLSDCVSDVASWMRSNRLQLNAAKTEVLWCSSVRRQHQIPNTPVMVGTTAVTPVCTVRNLGIYIDSGLTMRAHVAKTVSNSFAVLRHIRSIRRSVTKPVLQSLVVSMVLTRLDYGSATLAGLPNTLLNRLQSVLHAAARLIYSARKYDHDNFVTP